MLVDPLNLEPAIREHLNDHPEYTYEQLWKLVKRATRGKATRPLLDEALRRARWESKLV